LLIQGLLKTPYVDRLPFKSSQEDESETLLKDTLAKISKKEVGTKKNVLFFV